MAVTATATSLDGPLGRPLFRARTRTKYAPGLTPLAVNEVDVLPVFRLAMFDRPDAEPASMRYEVAAQTLAVAVQFNVTVAPFTLASNPVGALGGVVHTT